MATLNQKIKQYLKNNSKTYEAERKNYVLENHGSGDVISSWNVSGLAEPTADQLANCDAAANTESDLQVILRNRRNEYPSIADQLDDIYHNGIDAWKATIKTTKDKYPKG